MQNEFLENWTKACQSFTKPAMDLVQLNLTTLNNITKNSVTPEDFTHFKKPEEFFSAQMKFANAAYQEMARYNQKALEIGLNAMSEAGKVWTDTLNKSSNKTSELVKASINKNRE